MTETHATAAADSFPTTGPARELFIALAQLADGNGTYTADDLPSASAAARLDALTAGEAYELLVHGGWVTATGNHGRIEVRP